MKKTFALIGLLTLLFSCINESGQKVTEKMLSPIFGTWQLITVETIEGTDTTFQDYTMDIKGIKMFNDTYFSFFQHDLNQGIDSSAVFVSGGGTYSLEDGLYTENVEYCSVRVYEGKSFKFQVSISGDTLYQRGQEDVPEAGVSKYIIETYVRL